MVDEETFVALIRACDHLSDSVLEAVPRLPRRAEALSLVQHARRRPAPSISQRARIEAAVESLLTLLDAMDPDPDLEPASGQELGPGEQDEAEAVNEDGTETDNGEFDEAEMIVQTASRSLPELFAVSASAFVSTLRRAGLEGSWSNS